MKASGQYLNYLPSYEGSKNKPYGGERVESRESRERTRIIIHTLPKSHLAGQGMSFE